jgi:CheY-like chemotaxis protein
MVATRRISRSAGAAIANLEATPEIRALITDINLQDQITGWEVARRAREIFPDLPLVYVTSISAEQWTLAGPRWVIQLEC